MKRPTYAQVLGAALGTALLAGCSSQVLVSRDDLLPGTTFSSSEVRTSFGDYRFDRVEVAADSLFGEYVIEVQRQSSAHGIYYEDVIRQRAISLDDVVSVTLKKRNVEKTLFFGAGSFAVAVVMRDLFESEILRTGGGSSRTKPDPTR